MPKNYYKEKERTIPEELHKQWLKLVLPGEAPTIAKAIEVSAPVVYAAIKKGHVYRPTLVDKINKYFADNPRPENVVTRKEAKKRKPKTNKNASAGNEPAVNT